MPLSPDLAKWLRARGHDAIHAVEAGLDLAPDAAVLRFARTHGRVVITADLDFPRLFALLQLTAPGLILFRGGDFSEAEAEERLGRVLELVPEADLAASIVVVERQRIRRRSLPVETIDDDH